MFRWIIISLLLSGCSTSGNIAKNTAAGPFETLRQAYFERNAELAASAYSAHAELNYDYGKTIEIYKGRNEIQQSFDDFFSRLEPDMVLDLNFRLAKSTKTSNGLEQSGIYRLKFGSLDVSYGTFSVVINTEEGTFLYDFSTLSTPEAFEALPNQVMFN